tara:strand:- start:458 stop:853 length:396 start_codon:yes stop_codon:yes gene_type:complete
MDFKNMKVSIGIVIAIVVQAFGIIWYVAQLDSTVSNLDSTVAVMQGSQGTITELETALELIKESVDSERNIRHTTLDEILDSIDEIEKTQAVINNEMRTIMSDHSGFSDALKELGLSGYSDKRQYGNYSGQ